MKASHGSDYRTYNDAKMEVEGRVSGRRKKRCISQEQETVRVGTGRATRRNGGKEGGLDTVQVDS